MCYTTQDDTKGRIAYCGSRISVANGAYFALLGFEIKAPYFTYRKLIRFTSKVEETGVRGLGLPFFER